MEPKSFTYQNATIFYRTAGTGKPTMLIHGFAEDGDVWSQQIDSLKEQGYLIIPDLPGSGQSAMIPDMSIEGIAACIKSLLQHEQISQCTLLGHSMGGYISLAIAEKYPELIAGLGLIHSSAFADSEEKKANRLKSIEFVKKNGAFEFLKAVIVDLFTEQWAAENPGPVEKQIEKSKNFADAAVIAYYQAMVNRPDRTHILKNIGKPVLFIIGRHDKAVPFEQSMQQCYLPAVAHIHILRNSAHMGMLEESNKLNGKLLQFINFSTGQ